jgi:hypothetical protein
LEIARFGGIGDIMVVEWRFSGGNKRYDSLRLQLWFQGF